MSEQQTYTIKPLKWEVQFDGVNAYAGGTQYTVRCNPHGQWQMRVVWWAGQICSPVDSLDAGQRAAEADWRGKIGLMLEASPSNKKERR